MAHKGYRDESRKNYGTEDAKLTLAQVVAGAQLRTADAMESIAKNTEAMAQNHVQLQSDYDYMRKDRDYHRDQYEKECHRTRGLKGVITKLKNKVK